MSEDTTAVQSDRSWLDTLTNFGKSASDTLRVTDLGRLMSADKGQLAKSFQMASNIISPFGEQRDPSKPDDRFAKSSKAVAAMLQGQELGTTRPDPVVLPTQAVPIAMTPQVAPTTQAAPVETRIAQMDTANTTTGDNAPVATSLGSEDKNMNGIPDYLEHTTTTKVKVPASFFSKMGYYGETPNDLPFSKSITDQSVETDGAVTSTSTMPIVEAPVAPASQTVQQLAGNTTMNMPANQVTQHALDSALQTISGNGMSPDQLKYMNLAGLGGPNGFADALEVYKQGPVLQNADSARIKANADALEAGIKYAQLETNMAKTIAETNKLISDIDPKSVIALEYAKKTGDKLAERVANEAIIETADKIKIIEPRLKKYGTYGNLMRATGSTDIKSAVTGAISADATIEAARLRANAQYGAGSLQAEAMVKSAALGLIAQNNLTLKRMEKYELQLPEDSPNYQNQKNKVLLNAAIIATPQDMEMREAIKAQNKLLGDKVANIAGVEADKAIADRRRVSNSFKSTEEAKAAAKAGKIKAGDIITINGTRVEVKEK